LARLEKEIDPIKGMTTVCQYCNAQYLFSPEDIAKIRKEIQTKQHQLQPEDYPMKTTS
jgi:hypothetical protein